MKEEIRAKALEYAEFEGVFPTCDEQDLLEQLVQEFSWPEDLVREVINELLKEYK